MKMGDVIVSVDGKAIKNGYELVDIVSDTEVGKKLQLGFLRDGKVQTTQVLVGDRNKVLSELRDARDEEEQQTGTPSGGVLGLSVRNLTPDQAKEIVAQLRLESPQGVLVVDSVPEGFAAEMGMQRGDVILAVNRQPVKSVDEFNRLQGQLKSGDDVLFLIARRTQRTFTTLYLADRLPGTAQ
jgi:serine protease Do